MTIQITKDYDIFKMHPSNREINEGNLHRLIASIKARNLLEFRPIIVNEKMEVIDGQHRLAAAKALGIDIWYKLSPDSHIEDMIILNVNQKNWSLEDYLKHYTSTKCEEYIIFYNFITQEKIDIRQGLLILNNYSANSVRQFKLGLFKFPSGPHFNNIMLLLSNFNLIISIISNQKIGGRIVCQRSKFKTALLEILKINDLDFELFKDRMLLHLDKVRLCSGASEYLNMMKQIYNWRNKNPLE